MANLNEEGVLAILKEVKYPGYEQDVVSFGVVGGINLQGERITINLKFNTGEVATKKKVKLDIQESLKQAFPDKRIMVMEGVVSLNMPSSGKKADDPWAGRVAVPGINSILAVASGKGGVGKSTVSTNLAIALAKEGLSVGLLDSDIYGPSVHIMMGVDQKPMVSPNQKLLPIEKFGIHMMSMGFILDKDTPVIWRGPMVQKALEQFLREVEWGELDILIIDLPPGTGDVQLSLVQKTPLTGAVVVTTPQEVAVVDARRGHQMFRKLNIHTFGIIENMSYYKTQKNAEPVYVFGQGGGRKAADELGVPLLGEIPLDPEVAETGDGGMPVVAKNPQSDVSLAFRKIAQELIKQGLLERVAQ